MTRGLTLAFVPLAFLLLAFPAAADIVKGDKDRKPTGGVEVAQGRDHRMQCWLDGRLVIVESGGIPLMGRDRNSTVVIRRSNGSISTVSVIDQGGGSCLLVPRK